MVQDLKSAEDTAKQAGSNMGASITSAITKGMAGLGAAASAIFVAAIGSTTQWSNEVERLSRELGLTTEQASALIDVSDDLGVSSQTLSASFGIFAKNLAGISDMETAVAEGGKGFSDTLKDLGISMTDATGNLRPMNDLLPEIADQFMNMPDGLEKSALAMRLFGRGGKELIPVLNMGGEAIRAAAVDTERFGLSMSADGVKAARAFQVAQNNLGDAIKGVAVTIGNEILPKLTPFIEKIIEGVVAVRGFVKEHADLIAKLVMVGTAIGGPVAAFATLSKVMGIMSIATGPIAGILGGIAGALAPIILPVAAVAAGITLLVLAFKKLGERQEAASAMDMFAGTARKAATPFEQLGKIVAKAWADIQIAAKVGAALAGEAIGWLATQIDHAAGWIADRIEDLQPTFARIGEFLSSAATFVGDTLTWLLGIAVENLGALMTVFQDVFRLIYDLVTGNLSALGTDAGSILGDILNLFATILSNLFDIVGAVMSGISEFWGKVFDLLPEPVQNALTNILDNAKAFLDWIGGNFRKVWAAVLEVTEVAWRWVWDTIGTVLAGIANAIASFFEKLPGGMGAGWAKSLREFADNVGTGLGDRAMEAVRSIIDGLKSMGGSVADAVNGLMTPAATASGQNVSALQSLFDKIKTSIAGVIAKAKDFSTTFTLAARAATAYKPPVVAAAAANNAVAASAGNAANATQSMADPLATAADLLTKITGALDGAMTMFGKLAKYDISKEQFAAGWALLLGQVRITLTGLADLLSSMNFQGEAGAAKMTGMQALADLVGTIGNMVGSLQAGLSSIVKFIAPARANVDAILEVLRYLVAQLVIEAAKYKAEGLTAAGVLADTAGKIGAMLAAVVQPFADAAKFKAVAAGAFGALADAIDRWVKGMVWLAGQYKAEGLAAARDMADTAGVIGGMLASVIEPMADAATFKQVAAGAFGAIADAITRWVTGMVWLAGRYKEEGLAAARDMAATAGAIGEALAAVMQPFTDAAKFKRVAAGDFGPLADAILRWVQGMAYIKSEIEKGGWTLAAAQEMSATLVAIASGLGAFMAVLIELVKYTSAAALPAATFTLVNDIKTVIEIMHSGFSEWTAAFREVLKDVIADETLASALLSPVGGMIDNIASLVKYKAAVGLPAAAFVFVNDVKTIVEIMHSGFSEWTAAFREALLAAVASESLAATLLSPISGMIDAIASIVKYTPLAVLPTATWNFVQDVKTIAEIMHSGFSEWTDGFREALAVAVASATLAAALLSPISGLIASIVAVTGYVAAKDLRASVNAMLLDLDNMLAQMMAWIGSLLQATRDALPDAAEAAAAVGNLIAPVATAVEVLTALKTYTVLARNAARGIPQQISDLATDLRDLVLGLADKLGGLTITQSMTDAAGFLNSILSPIKSWTEIIEGVRYYVRLARRSGESIPLVVQNMAADLEALIEAVAAMTIRLGEKVKTAGQTGTLMGPLGSAIQSIMQVFWQLSNWRRPPNFGDAVTQLGADINTLVSRIANIVLTPANTATLETFAKTLLPMTTAVLQIMTIFDRLAQGQALLQEGALKNLFANVNTFIEYASQTTNWHNLGQAATRSWVEGLALGLADEAANLELGRRMAALRAKFADFPGTGGGGEAGTGGTMAPTSTTNYLTVTITNPIVDSDIRIRQLVDEVVNQILRKKGARVTVLADATVPQW
jgi:TP901 family phage tail tape measure protein